MKLFSIASILSIVAAATPAVAGVNVGINLGAPVVVHAAPPPPPAPVYRAAPEIVVNEAPQFIFSPALGIHVAVGVPYDMVYTGNEYLYFHGGQWYRSNSYNGHWVRCSTRHLPPAMRRHSVNQIRHYRDQEYRHYRNDRAHYNGRFFRPDSRGGDRQAHVEHWENNRGYNARR